MMFILNKQICHTGSLLICGIMPNYT